MIPVRFVPGEPVECPACGAVLSTLRRLYDHEQYRCKVQARRLDDPGECAEPGCTVRLSLYNCSPWCFRHRSLIHTTTPAEE